MEPSKHVYNYICIFRLSASTYRKPISVCLGICGMMSIGNNSLIGASLHCPELANATN